MAAIGYYNGTIGPLERMTVPMLDRAGYFGDGCYEACLVRNGKAFALDEHLDRFWVSLSLLRIKEPCPRETLEQILSTCIRTADEPEALLYWQCSRGTGPRKHPFLDASIPSNLCVMVTPKPLPPAEATMRLMTAEDIRFSMCHAKTLNLLPNVLINQQAADRGLGGAILVRDGIVTEGTHSNVAILKDGALITHPADQFILKGITRQRLFVLCERYGVPVWERPFAADELFTADEVLISSSSAHIRSAVEIDGKPVGGGAPELLRTLQQAYLRMFLEETDG